MSRMTLLLIALTLSTPPARAQSSISGYVLSVDTGEPIAHALIMLKDEAGLDMSGYPPIRSDDDGFYSFGDIPSGRYGLRASTIYELERDSIGVYIAMDVSVADTSEAVIHLGFSKSHAVYSHRWRTVGPAKEIDIVRHMMLRPRIRDGRGKEIIPRMISVQNLN